MGGGRSRKGQPGGRAVAVVSPKADAAAVAGGGTPVAMAADTAADAAAIPGGSSAVGRGGVLTFSRVADSQKCPYMNNLKIFLP